MALTRKRVATWQASWAASSRCGLSAHLVALEFAFWPAWEEDTVALMRKRVYDLAGVLGSTVKVCSYP